MSLTLLEKARKLSHLTRKDLAEALDITEYRVRELRREIAKEEEAEHFKDPFLAVWDLETTGLKGDFGRLLCGSILSYPSGEIKTFRIDNVNGGSPNKARMSRRCLSPFPAFGGLRAQCWGAKC